MAIAVGVAKSLSIAKQTALGTVAAAGNGQLLRRVTSDLNLEKDTYQSQEIRSDYQIADYRHGFRRIGGTINGEVSLATYKLMLAAALRKDWTAGVTMTASAGDGITVSNSGKTFTRAAGGGQSFLTDGFKIGDVIRAATLDASINGKNLRVTNVTATVLTVADSPGADVAVADETCSIAVAGSKIWVPTTAHTRDYFTIEHWFSDINQSERFEDCVVNTVGIQMPATGMATVAFGMMGRQMTPDTSQYFTSPTAETTSAVMAAVNGSLRVGGSDIAVVTGLSLDINGGFSQEAVVGANISPDIFPGRVVATGQFTAFFENGTLRDNFINEDEIALQVKMDAGSAATTDFLSIVMNRIKVGSATKNDGEVGLVATFNYQALLNGNGGTGTAYDKTTIAIQDSTVV